MILILSENTNISTGKVEKWLNYYGANYLRVNDEEYFDIIKEVKISSSETEIPDTLISDYGKELKFSQEMTGSADIITDDIRLLQRFLNPLKFIWKQSVE